ncbi:MAG: polysaccharide biosynthesis/export family protein [Bacteroidota bacterium]|nr:polysaccharide biosynthesis/export family protein [Bacteroidota bacterium]
MKNYLRICVAALLVVSAASCNTWKKINYLQDIEKTTTMNMVDHKGIVIQPKDQLSIIVSCRVPELAAQFNLPVATYAAGSEIASLSGGSAQRLSGYVVDNEGFINFPQVGRIEVAGLTRWELQDKIVEEITSRGFVNDPVVTVEFMNFRISILGEVARPGTYTITGDKVNLFQALSLAGDLTIYGERPTVKVTREHNGERTVYVLDLRNSEVFNSPAFYLQQNDIIYVVPNSVRAGQSTINENYFKSGAFWISLSSVSMTLVTLIVTLSK